MQERADRRSLPASSSGKSTIGLLSVLANDYRRQSGRMFARSVSMRLKPNSTVTFNNTLENEVLPLLRAQKGFRDEVVLVAQDGTEVVGISLWDDRESADSYHKERYPE